MVLPGILTSVVAHSPVFGGKVAGFNAETAKPVPGVKDVVRITTGVAVVADDFWTARKGRDLLDVVWNEGENSNSQPMGYARNTGDCP